MVRVLSIVRSHAKKYQLGQCVERLYLDGGLGHVTQVLCDISPTWRAMPFFRCCRCRKTEKASRMRQSPISLIRRRNLCAGSISCAAKCKDMLCFPCQQGIHAPSGVAPHIARTRKASSRPTYPCLDMNEQHRNRRCQSVSGRSQLNPHA